MKIERDKFLTQLERLKPALPNSSGVPAFLHIWFDGAQARSYDGGLGIVVPCKTDFELGVPGKPLLGLMAGTATEQAEVYHSGNGSLDIKIGRAHMQLATLPSSGTAWPAFPAKAPPKTPSITLSEEFLDALRRVLLIKPDKPRRVEHNGVSLYLSDSGVKLLSTDSHSIAQIEVKAKIPDAADMIVLPRPFVEQMIAQCAPGAKLYILSDCLMAVGENVTLYSNMLDNSALTDLPGMVDRLITGQEASTAVPKGLSVTLSRAELLAAGEKEPQINLSVQDGHLTLAASYKLGDITDVIELAAPALPDGEITVELAQLQTGLKEAERFAISPRVLIFHGSNNFLCLIAGRADKKEA